MLGESPLGAGGSFQFHVTQHLASDASVHVVLGPKGLDGQSLAGRAELPRVALGKSQKHEGRGINVEFAIKNINEVIDPWWIWCREYTVSGTLKSVGGCPVPGQVTVYNVTSGVSGLTKNALTTVTTDANGNFTATFNWCSWRWCWWPCWPFWWHCWPWWWELDILAVLAHLEQQVLPLVNPGGPVEAAAARVMAPLRQPSTADLMTGVGFAALRQGAIIERDESRTALIAAKLANPAIREIFPWWWWCCQNPNIVFSAMQGTTTVLDEDPNTSTRWCFPSGETVALTGNSQSLGACPVNGGGECAFAWTSVGGEPPLAVLVSDITMGYANGGGGACRNLAFAGSLNLNGVMSGDCIAYYQVLAGQWGGGGGLAVQGNPARGGTTPVSYSPLSESLINYVTIWRNGVGPAQYAVGLGPFSYNGVSNLYVSLAQRQNTGVPLPAPVTAAIGAFPALGPGDFVIGWAYPDLVLTVPSTDLVSPALTGGANLTIAAYDVNANPVTVPDMGPELTLTIDNSPLTPATVDSVLVYNSDGTPATQTTESSTECPAYKITTPGGGYALIHVTVEDEAAHLCEYFIQTQYGNSSYLAGIQPSDRDYAQAAASFTPPSPPAQLYGVDAGYGTPDNASATLPAATNWTYTGGGDTFYIPITKSCCYDFQLWVSKRTTNGQTTACGAWNAAFQTVNIAVGS